MPNIESENKHYNKLRDFTTLEAWEKARTVKLFFYSDVIPHLPAKEKFNLNIQIRKAGVSGTANISEGYGRYHFREGIQFYKISRALIYELKDHLISCYDLKFIAKITLKKGIDLIEDAKITLNGYIKYVKSQKNNFKEQKY